MVSTKKDIQSKATTLEKSLALAEFTLNLLEDKRGKDEELTQLKKKFETELETYKQLLETAQKSKIEVEQEVEEKWKKESTSREHLEKAVKIERAEWKREGEKWRIEKNDLMQKWNREKSVIESEVKKRKGLEIDKTRLEREILELQRRADRERTKREELEIRLETSDLSKPPLSPSSPASNTLTRFDSMFFERMVGDDLGHTAAGVEEDVAKKRLRIERGEYEREIEALRKENDILKKESEQLKRDKRRKSVDTEKHSSSDRPPMQKLEVVDENKFERRRKLSWDLDRDKESPNENVRLAIDRRKSVGEREESYDKDGEGSGLLTDRAVERRRSDMEREIEIDRLKKQTQMEKDHERSKWKVERDKELERLKKYQELEKTSLLKERNQLRNEKDKYINDLRIKLEEQVVKVQIWEEEVTEMSKELKDRELDRLREAAKAERERSGKQLDEQETEIMRLKTLLYGEKNEFYRLMEQEKAKMKADRSNELEALQKEVDVQRASRVAIEKEIAASRHGMTLERQRYRDDAHMWRKERDTFEDRIRRKDAEIAKIQSETMDERPKLTRRTSRADAVGEIRVEINGVGADEKMAKPPQPKELTETEIKVSNASSERIAKLTEELRQKDVELCSLQKTYDEEKAKWQFALKEHEMKVKMWEEEVEELEKSHRTEREKECSDMKETHTKEIKKWERAAEEALSRLNSEKSAELKTLKDAVKLKLAKHEKKYKKQTEMLEGIQQKHAQQSLEYSIMQSEQRVQSEELGSLRDKYRKEIREWESKWAAKEAETESLRSKLMNEVERLQKEMQQQRKTMEEEIILVVGKLEDKQQQLQFEIQRLETENVLLQQLAIKEKDNATLIARQWVDKERKAADGVKRQLKKDEQKREEERNAREKESMSKLTAKFKEIERIVSEDFVDSVTEETSERLLRRMEHVRMLLLADKKPKKKPKSTTTTTNNSNNNNNTPTENQPNDQANTNNTNTNTTTITTTAATLAALKEWTGKDLQLKDPFAFNHGEGQPAVSTADLLEKDLDSVLRELHISKGNHRELTTQVWDLRRQLGDARKYFEKTLRAIEEEANFNLQHIRRSYEEQIEALKGETKRANRLLEQALNRHATGAAALLASAPPPNVTLAPLPTSLTPIPSVPPPSSGTPPPPSLISPRTASPSPTSSDTSTVNNAHPP